MIKLKATCLTGEYLGNLVDVLAVPEGQYGFAPFCGGLK
jgi:hypothetical protein